MLDGDHEYLEHTSPWLLTLVLHVVLLIWIVVAVLILAHAARTWNRGEQSRGWPTAPGVVVRSELVHRQDPDGGRTSAAEVRYRYTVGGTAYVGDRIAFGGGLTNLERMNAELDRYLVGTKVTVRYDAADPAMSVLEPGATNGVWWPIGFGTVMLAFALWMYRILWRQRQELQAIRRHNPWLLPRKP